ncbi:DUF2586 family protein [Hymenobacter sp. H14-R3]|uniref:DUF2586 family protein n=1 Tax=Hymenobacter sp. H14-R3 TaxID=3046308 RepID=UPI0024B8B08B|nr:DUF2586 family protein [Hymenobacter sp. H14-R3]MDJ0363573.1 DUF2586 family protein [Hymenobacter sp. H14-R3]
MAYERPNVTIDLGNGQLGRQLDNADGLALLVVGAPLGYAMLEAQVYSLRGAEVAGATSAADVVQQSLVWEHIKDFYEEAGDGAPLRVLAVPATTTLTNLFTSGQSAYVALQNELKGQGGKVKLLGVVLNPAAAEVAGPAGITTDLATAIPLAQVFADAEFAAFRPVDMLLEGRLFSGTATAALDLRTLASKNVAVTIGRDQLRSAALVASGIAVAGKYAQVGKVLGRLAAIPVQRSIGRVKDGKLASITQASLSGGALVSSLSDGPGGDLSLLSGKGYIFPLIHPGKDGFFYNDDPTCAAATDDYAFVKDSRVINKAARIARAAYLEELLDDVQIDRTTGYLPVIEVARFQNVLKNAIEGQMQAQGNIVSCDVYVNPKQNVTATAKIVALLKIVKTATGAQIEATVEFYNPFTTI